jgi:ornithine decarboxylase
VLWDNGVTHYDTASIAEVRLVRETLARSRPCASCTRSSPSPRSTKPITSTAFARSASTHEELEKIVEATRDRDGNAATDLSLCVRLRVSSEYSELSLASKFGIDLADAAPLLQATRQVADCLGICFHVGSQAMTPFAYVQALERVRAAIVDASVTVDIIDVGGGFPRSIRGWSRAAGGLFRLDPPRR